MENKHGKIEVVNCQESLISTQLDLVNSISAAMKSRNTCGTHKNDTSSRSHAINVIRIKNNSIPEAEDGIL